MKGVIILGFPKCGTTSLMSYLSKRYTMKVAKDKGFYSGEKEPVVQRREWCYLPFEEQLKRFKHEFGDPKDFKICFITRDPVERIWSGWEAWSHHYKGYTFEEYLNLDSDKYEGGLKYLGEVNPIKQVDYWKWIDPWNEYRPNVYNLEGVSTHPDFPQTNSLKTSEVPDKYKELIINAFPKVVYY